METPSTEMTASENMSGQLGYKRVKIWVYMCSYCDEVALTITNIQAHVLVHQYKSDLLGSEAGLNQSSDKPGSVTDETISKQKCDRAIKQEIHEDGYGARIDASEDVKDSGPLGAEEVMKTASKADLDGESLQSDNTGVGPNLDEVCGGKEVTLEDMLALCDSSDPVKDECSIKNSNDGDYGLASSLLEDLESENEGNEDNIEESDDDSVSSASVDGNHETSVTQTSVVTSISSVTPSSSTNALDEQVKGEKDKTDKNSRRLTKFKSKDRKHQCPECVRKFHSALELKKHMAKVHTAERKHKCPDCGSTFMKLEYMKRHMSRRHGLNLSRTRYSKDEKHRFQCDQCSKFFNRPSSLKDHIATHSEERPHKCSICPKDFRQERALTKHIRYVHGSPTDVVQCPYCEGMYKAGDYLNQHILKMHKRKKEATPCDICGKVYKDEYNMRVHKKMIHGDGRKELCTCDICGATFTTKCGYKTHMIKHAGTEAHMCPICDRRFVYRAELMYHMEKHENRRRFQCDVCGEGFNSKVVLKKHALVHTDARPYACTLCAKTFRQSNGLQKHMISHTGEKPYECPYCDGRFSQSSARNLHIKNKHPEHYVPGKGVKDVVKNDDIPDY